MGTKKKPIDPLLLDYVSQGIRDNGHDITLLANGMAITGTITSTLDYFRLTVIRPDSSQSILDLESKLAEWDEEWRQADRKLLRGEDLDAEDEDALETKDFINLKDARYQSGAALGQLVPTDGTCMRVRLSSVDAWFSGKLIIGSAE